MQRSASTSAIDDLDINKNGSCKYWCIVDAKNFDCYGTEKPLLESLNHLGREVMCVQKSKDFYCGILGFKVGFL